MNNLVNISAETESPSSISGKRFAASSRLSTTHLPLPTKVASTVVSVPLEFNVTLMLFPPVIRPSTSTPADSSLFLSNKGIFPVISIDDLRSLFMFIKGFSIYR